MTVTWRLDIHQVKVREHRVTLTTVGRIDAIRLIVGVADCFEAFLTVRGELVETSQHLGLILRVLKESSWIVFNFSVAKVVDHFLELVLDILSQLR